jgi:hypothetical protein
VVVLDVQSGAKAARHRLVAVGDVGAILVVDVNAITGGGRNAHPRQLAEAELMKAACSRVDARPFLDALQTGEAQRGLHVCYTRSR